jgi:molybdopterin-guanine dinucleotide biosynthesis protein A
MPFMNEEHVRFLCSQIAPSCGVLPMIGDRAQPLAAIYPVEACVDVAAAISGKDVSMQTATNRLVKAKKLRLICVSQTEQDLYRNLNEPGDLES